MQNLPEDELYALVHVPPTLKLFKCRCGSLSCDEWDMMPEEVQLTFLLIKELEPQTLDHLRDARYISCDTIKEEAFEHLPTKVPHLRTLSATHVPRDMVMRLSCMPDLAKLFIKNGEESVIDLSKGFEAV